MRYGKSSLLQCYTWAASLRRVEDECGLLLSFSFLLPAARVWFPCERGYVALYEHCG